MPSDFKCASDAENWIDRFCYWQGRTGKRYLFTKIDLEELPGFADCVLLLALEQKDASPILHWVGEIKDFTPQCFRTLSADYAGGLTAYIHLLSDNGQERQKMVLDLADRSDKQNWTLSA